MNLLQSLFIVAKRIATATVKPTSLRGFEPKVRASGYRHRPGTAIGRGKASHKANARKAARA